LPRHPPDPPASRATFHDSFLASLAALKSRYVKDFHRPCTITGADSTVTGIDVAFDTCAEFTNYARRAFIDLHFPGLHTHRVAMGAVGGSLGGSQPREHGVTLQVAATDHLLETHSWTLDFVVLDTLPYDIFIGSTTIKSPAMRDFFFQSSNWIDNEFYVAHEFDDAQDAEEDNGPPPGLFPDDYFNLLLASELPALLREAADPDYLASDPAAIATFASYTSTWINNHTGLINIPLMKIQWADNTPAEKKTYTQKYAPDLMVKAEQEFVHLKSIGFMVDSKSLTLSPLTVAPKKTPPGVRLCGNYKGMNAFMINRNLRIPVVREEINKCLGFSVFAELDWERAYHQIRLHPEDSPRLALKTLWGNVQPIFLWEGVKSASDLMEHAKTLIFTHEDFGDWTVALFDNILICATSYADLTTKLRRVLDRAVHFNLVLNLKKSKLGVKTIDFFGYTITKGTIAICADRLQPILDMPPPDSLTKMRTFLGLCQAFSAFTPGYSDTLLLLNRTTSNTFPWPPAGTPAATSPVWSGDDGAERLAAFMQIKTLIAGSLTLHFPDYALDWTIRTDASEFAISGTIIQHRRPGDHVPEPTPSLAMLDSKISTMILPATEEVIYVFNHILSATAARWDIHKKEAFAIVATIRHFAHLLWGKAFIIETDHRNLEYLQDNTSSIVRRWMHTLAQYDYIVKHIPGKTNILADALSRLYAFICVFNIDLADLFAYHHSAEKGHYRVAETLRRLQHAGVPCTEAQVQKLCDDCLWCQLNANRPRIAQRAESKIIATTASRQQVGMDGLGPFHLNGTDYYIITAVDQFDKFPTLFLAPDKSQTSYFRALVSYIARNDIFDTLRTDRGSDFTSALAVETAAFFRINHIFSPVGRPQGSGTEGTNKQVNRILSAILSKYRDSGLGLLPEYISLVEFVLRNHVSSETGVSPFVARFGHTSRFPLIWDAAVLAPTNSHAHLAAVQAMFQQIQSAILEHKTALQTPRACGTPSLLVPGDYVKLIPLSKPPHGDTRYSGPYLVTGNDGHNNIACSHVINGRSAIYHPERLIPFIGDRDAAFAAGLLSTKEHVVLAIITHRGSPHLRSEMEFQVSWANKPSADDSWLPWSAIKDNALFDTYCVAHQLFSLRVSAALSRQQHAMLNRLPIADLLVDSIIYVPLRKWSIDNTWYDALQLPDTPTHTYLVLGRITRFNAARTAISIYFPVFSETYPNIKHAEFASYGHSTQLAPTDIVISAEFIAQYPQIMQLDTRPS
jgi:hypothetical protein